MADKGKPIDDATRTRIIRLLQYTPIKQTARLVGVSKNTVKKYLRKALVV